MLTDTTNPLDWRLVAAVDSLGLAEDPTTSDPQRRVFRGGRRSARPAITGGVLVDILGDVGEWGGKLPAKEWAWADRWSIDDVREVFLHHGTNAVLTWNRGELTLVACADRDAFAEELSRLREFYANERKSRDRAARGRGGRLAMA